MPVTLLVFLGGAAFLLALGVAAWAGQVAIDARVQADVALRLVHQLLLRADRQDAEARHLRGRVSRLEERRLDPLPELPVLNDATVDFPGPATP